MEMGNAVELDRKKILKLRQLRCWSQEELASASGLSVRTIQRVEKTGTASLETVKSLAAVFDMSATQLKEKTEVQNMTFKIIARYGWLVAFAISFTLFGLWVIDILVPTLKGADFDNQYELHGNFRYLDYGSASFVLGFVWLGMSVFIGNFTQSRLSADLSGLDQADEQVS